MKKPAAQHRQTTHAVAAHAKPARPAAPSGSQTGGKGTATGKHHSATAKHTARRARKWSPDEDVALCSLRAVAAAQQRPVSDGELLAIYFSLTADADAGLTIGEAVLAMPGALRMPVLGVGWPQPHAVAVDPSGLWWSWGALHEPWTDEIDETWVPTWR